MKFRDFVYLNEGAREDRALKILASEIKGTEYEGHVYLAGGAVRDEIMGKSIKDIDLMINKPNGGIQFAEFICKKLKIFKQDSNPVTYPRFGTAKFVLDVDGEKMDIECVMPRKEQYSIDSRKPDVSNGSLEDDVLRRDLTINSLLKNISTGEILDLTGKGRDDIKNGILRTPLSPDIIFKDDPLRMLRVVRFAVKYGFSIEQDVMQGIVKNAYRLESQAISVERIQDELNKILLTAGPDEGIELLRETGLLKYILPELESLKGMSQNKYHKDDVYGHILDVTRNTQENLVARLAGLLHDIGKGNTRSVKDGNVHFYGHEGESAKMAREILKRLKYSNDVIDRVCVAVANHMRTKQYGKNSEIVSDKSVRKLCSDLADNLDYTLDLIHADNISHADDHILPDQIPSLRNRIKLLPMAAKLPINGNDLVGIGFQPGPIMKDILDFVRDQVHENPHLTKDQAISLVQKRFARE